jgi:hypothetical protein
MYKFVVLLFNGQGKSVKVKSVKGTAKGLSLPNCQIVQLSFKLSHFQIFKFPASCNR